MLPSSSAAASSSSVPGPRAGPVDPFDATSNFRLGHVIPPGVCSPDKTVEGVGTVHPGETALEGVGLQQTLKEPCSSQACFFLIRSSRNNDADEEDFIGDTTYDVRLSYLQQ